MNDLQKNLYKLLLEIDGICRKHGITYFVAGGTALGIVRGGDFMPWDDDIDLYITLENWKKLRRVMKTELPPDRDFICEEETELYCNPIGRYADKNSTEMRVSQILCGRACGQIVEFFIMDPMPLQPEAKKEFVKTNKAFVELASPYFVVNRDIFGANKAFDYKVYNKYYLKGLIKGHKHVLDELRHFLTNNSEENCDYFCVRWGLETLIYKKDWVKTVRYENLNGQMIPVANMAEKIFRYDYGDDWMYVPDNDNKLVHDADKDLKTPYETYTKIYSPLLNKRKLLHAYKRNKRSGIKGMVSKEKAFLEFAALRAKLAETHIAEKGFDNDAVICLLKNKEFDKLEEIFAVYYESQLNKTLRDCGIMVNAPAEYIAAALMNRIMQGRYFTVGKIIEIVQKSSHADDSVFTTVIDAYNFCKSLSEAIYDDNDKDKVKELLLGGAQYKGSIIDYNRAELWLKTNMAVNENDYEDIINYAHESLEQFENDGEIIRYEAFALARKGMMDQAREKYETAVRYTRNGFVWKEAKQLFNIDPFSFSAENEIHVKWNEKKKKLFIELDRICKENGLRYVVVGSENPCIAMVNGDIEKLISIVNSQSNGRIVEYLLNNPKANNFGYRYCDTESTEIDLLNYRNHSYNGIHVDILEISKIPKNAKKEKLRNAVLYCSNIRNKGLINWELVLGSACLKLFTTLLGGRKLFERMLRNRRSAIGFQDWNEISSFENVKVGNKTIKSAVLNEQMTLKAFEHEFITFEGMLDFNIHGNGRNHKMTILMDDALPFETIKDEKSYVHLKNAGRLYDKYIGHYLWSGFHKLRIKHAQWTYLMTRDYVSFRTQYDTNEIQLIEMLITDGKIDEARQKLRPYLESKKKWKKRRVKFIELPEVESLINKLM